MEAPYKLTGDQPHTTVLLSSKFSDVYKPFHCTSCGNVVFEYNEEEVRTIIPSGYPQLNKPGKIYRCSGVMSLHGTSRIYDVLYQVMEVAMNSNNLEDIHTAIAYIAQTSDEKTNARCKMLYFVS